MGNWASKSPEFVSATVVMTHPRKAGAPVYSGFTPDNAYRLVFTLPASAASVGDLKRLVNAYRETPVATFMDASSTVYADDDRIPPTPVYI